jgi:hypothetical protein
MSARVWVAILMACAAVVAGRRRGFHGLRVLPAYGGGPAVFLLRLGSKVRLLRELGYFEREDRDRVYLWPERNEAEQASDAAADASGSRFDRGFEPGGERRVGPERRPEDGGLAA